jgi:hypothetical protein
MASRLSPGTAIGAEEATKMGMLERRSFSRKISRDSGVRQTFLNDPEVSSRECLHIQLDMQISAENKCFDMDVKLPTWIPSFLDLHLSPLLVLL